MRPRSLRFTAAAALGLGAWMGAAQAYDLPPPPLPLFQGLIVPLHPQGPGTLPTRAASPKAGSTPRATVDGLTLARSPAQVDANARQLATAFPPAQQAQMAKSYVQAFDVYRQLEGKLGVPANDVAGAVAAYIAGNYMALRNVEVPDAHYQSLVTQMRETLTTQARFVNAPAASKRQMYEQLAMVGTFMAVARQAFVQNPNPSSEQNFRNAARANLEAVLKQPVDDLQIGPAGLSLK